MKPKFAAPPLYATYVSALSPPCAAGWTGKEMTLQYLSQPTKIQVRSTAKLLIKAEGLSKVKSYIKFLCLGQSFYLFYMSNI